MKQKKNDQPQIKMDLSDLNFDWEDDLKEGKEQKAKKKKPVGNDDLKRPVKNSESVGKTAVSEVSPKADLNEEYNPEDDEPIMTFEEIQKGKTASEEKSAEENDTGVKTTEEVVSGEAAGDVVSVENTSDQKTAENAEKKTAENAAGTPSEEKTSIKESNTDEKPRPKKKKRKKDEEEEDRPVWKEILELAIYLVVVFILSYLIVVFVGQRTIVEGSSMNPTLVDGDNLIVDKMTYRFKDPQRFDVIVFPYQHAKHTFYIKRIIGLPGETVLIDDEGNIYINGNILSENYGNEVIRDPGRAREEIVLGADEYFVMGDNRNNSSDSRDIMVGNVKRKDFIGRAWLRIYPFNKLGLVKHASDEK